MIVIIYKKKIEKKIHKIVIHNLNNIDESLVRRKINLNEGQSFWDFNSTKLTKELKKIKGIKSFSFRMENNGILNIFIEEDEPFMMWKFSNKKKYLDENGEILDFFKIEHRDLIILEGELNKEKLKKFNKILTEETKLKKNILKINYTANIGWKIFFKDQSCLYLPDKKVAKVINVYKKIRNYKLYDNFKFFDMRILERVYMNKKNKCLIS